MGAALPILSLVSLVILAGGVLLQFFVILSGGVNSSPENQFYFLQASTNGIPNAAENPARWTFFAICGVDGNGHNANCRSPTPALPFDPPRNFGTQEGVPEDFIGTNKFYLLSRFMFAFYLIALFFAALALLTGLLALCSRLGAYLSSGLTLIALFFQALAAALMTAWVVQGHRAFTNAGLDASYGQKVIGFTWASFACFFLNAILFCIGGKAGGNDGTSYRAPKKGFFGRKRSTRSRGSLRDSRIKDDYS